MLDQPQQKREDMFLIGEVLVDFSNVPHKAGDEIARSFFPQSPSETPDISKQLKEPYQV